MITIWQREGHKAGAAQGSSSFPVVRGHTWPRSLGPEEGPQGHTPGTAHPKAANVPKTPRGLPWFFFQLLPKVWVTNLVSFPAPRQLGREKEEMGHPCIYKQFSSAIETNEISPRVT